MGCNGNGWLAGFEPATARSTIWCSTVLSYSHRSAGPSVGGPERTPILPGPVVREWKAMPTAAEFDETIKSGELIESPKEMTPEYLRELKHTLIVSGDTELISAPAYYLAAKRAPSINAFMTGIAIIQDELAHAH